MTLFVNDNTIRIIEYLGHSKTEGINIMDRYTRDEAKVILLHAIEVSKKLGGTQKDIAIYIGAEESDITRAKGNSSEKRYLKDHQVDLLIERYGKPYSMNKGRYLVAEKCTDTNEFCEVYQDVNNSYLARELLELWIDNDIVSFLQNSFSIHDEEVDKKEQQFDSFSYIKAKLCELFGDEEYQAWYKDHGKIVIDDFFIEDPSDDECWLKEILRKHNLETSLSYTEIIFFEWLGYLAYEHKGIELFAFEDTRYKVKFPTNLEYVICGENILTIPITFKSDNQYNELVEQYKKRLETISWSIPKINPDKVPRLHDCELKIYKTDNNNYYCNIELQVGSKVRNIMVKLDSVNIVRDINAILEVLEPNEKVNLFDLKVQLAEAGASIMGVTSLS